MLYLKRVLRNNIRVTPGQLREKVSIALYCGARLGLGLVLLSWHFSGCLVDPAPDSYPNYQLESVRIESQVMFCL